jgi:ABC-type glycerol-3-phosphate transport system substrate-binding protein
MKKKSALILAGLLCALSFASCQSSSPTSEKGAAGGSGDQPKMVIAISEQQEYFYRKAIAKYCKLHPETEVEIEVIPYIDNTPTKKTEKDRKAAKDMQVQIMAGKGPDVFLLDENNEVLPDMIKSSYNGVFLDLNTVMDGLKDLPLNQTVLKAGEIDGKQYFLPLGYMLTGIAVTDDMLGDWRPSSDQPAQFLEEVANHTGVEKFPSEFLLKDYIPGLFGSPVLDYEEKTITFSQELQDLAELLAERQELSSEEVSELPNVALMGHYTANSFETFVQNSLTSGIDVTFLPFPNGEGGINAQVNVFAAVRANSACASQAGEFLAFLLSDEMQGSTGWENFGSGRMPTALPINNNAFVPVYQYRFTYGTEEYQEAAAKKAEELFQLTQQATTARFCQYENSLVFNAVFMTSENSSAEKKLDDLKNELRFYFEE